MWYMLLYMVQRIWPRPCYTATNAIQNLIPHWKFGKHSVKRKHQEQHTSLVKTKVLGLGRSGLKFSEFFPSRMGPKQHWISQKFWPNLNFCSSPKPTQAHRRLSLLYKSTSIKPVFICFLLLPNWGQTSEKLSKHEIFNWSTQVNPGKNISSNQKI